ncbi:MAG: hypothetical protein ACM3Q4_13665 [Acidobacteriota bacterium]
MTSTFRRDIALIGLILMLLALPSSIFAQTAKADKVLNYPGAGVLQAGDIWESFLPENYTLPTWPTAGVTMMIKIGNFDRQWSTPGSHWPNAYPWSPYWGKWFFATVYDTSTTWNPEKVGTQNNPSYYAADKAAGGAYSNYSQLQYKPTVLGASDPARNYTIDPYFTDSRRQHVVYEAGWPTNNGIDVKFRAHAFTAPNWGNLNDYVIMEVTFKNTGMVDMNMDGVAEMTNHKIAAFSAYMGSQSHMSTSNYQSGLRGTNGGTTPIGRQTAYVGDPDPQGNPWDFVTVFASASTANPPAGQGKMDMGFNNGRGKEYNDIWYGWVMLDVKKGKLPADVNKSVADLPSKETIFGTHPIGLGKERGWYAGAHATKVGYGAPRQLFLTSVGQWFKDAGRTYQNNPNNFNLEPNPNFFSAGKAGEILTFVPKAQGRTMPNGDAKYCGVFDQTSFEDGSADAQTKYPNGYGKFSIGASHSENYDGEMYSAVGPFSLDVNEEVTVVLATVAGFRLEGIQRAVEAARWAFGKNLDIPKTPALPKLLVKNTLNKSTTLEWDAAAEADPQFAGYKIWKASQFKKKSWLEEGMRIVDRYQEQMTPGPIPSDLKKPINPKFDAFAAINATTLQGKYQPDTWGTYDLMKVIPKSELANLTKSTTTGYNYLFEDKDVVLGFSYWYYVSAYKEGSYEGPAGQTTTRIETHSTNRNGASALWNLTYPYAFANVNYPSATNQAAWQAMGGVQVVNSALAPANTVANVGVRPNPYKRAALHDNRALVYDHKMFFYNLPSPCKITIVDVAGQIVDEINFSSANPNVGSTFWDMFSKDGIEVASGLYIYIVESGSQKKVGHFAILR